MASHASGHGVVRKRARIEAPDATPPSIEAVLDPSLDHNQQNENPFKEPARPSPSAARSGASSAFRNVSACNRCRHRKNRCDQQLPACSACTKAGVKCVGFDPLTKREIPRSYVYYLESRTAYLERLLDINHISYESAESFALGDHDGSESSPQELADATAAAQEMIKSEPGTGGRGKTQQEVEDEKKLDSLVSDITLVSVKGASDPRFLGSESGISFARVVLAAVKSTAPLSRRSSVRSSLRPTRSIASSYGEPQSMRDSFFGLHTKPTIKEAPFPEEALGRKLVDLYFEHANPQIPTIHRGEFMKLFNRVYTTGHVRTSRETYFMNIVFAIGAGIIVGKPKGQDMNSPTERELEAKQCQPEEYHAAAIVHLEGVLGSSASLSSAAVVGGGLEELQAVLLLAGFALLRPVSPGLWYIVGVAVRLAIDLGLHFEDSGPETPEPEPKPKRPRESVITMASSTADHSNPTWNRDFRRRLWWCVYSFDRLVSTCVGRPFGISDQVITTPFPSLLDDKFITTDGFTQDETMHGRTYKLVAYHYFRLRLLQSEILQVLQHQQAQRTHAITGQNLQNPWMHTELPSPFMQNFASFKEWRTDIDRRLTEWKDGAPSQDETGVAFSPLFLELNYWQAVILLYRQGLTAPAELAGHVNEADDDVGTPPSQYSEEPSDQEVVFMKIAEAGQRILYLYRQLHRMYLVNYTYLATHHLFMAGICFLYAIWHSVTVRAQLTLDNVDFTVLAATSVLGDLTEQCPPARTCKEAFSKMSKATIQMCLSTTGFGPQAFSALARKRAQANDLNQNQNQGASPPQPPLQERNSGRAIPTRTLSSGLPHPQFDMNLQNLFTPGESQSKPFGQLNNLPDGSQVARGSTTTLPQRPSPQILPQQQQRSPPSWFPMRSPDSQSDLYRTPSTAADTMSLSGMSYRPRNSVSGADFYSLDFLDEVPESMDTSSSGPINMNLFGMGGVDLSTDWGNGAGTDLFEGFFFGGGQSGDGSGFF